MPFRTDDLPALLADFGETWTFGSLTATGIRDDADEVTPGPDGYELQGKVETVLFRASDFSALTVGSTLTDADGTSYTVRAVQREGADAAMKRAIIVEATS